MMSPPSLYKTSTYLVSLSRTPNPTQPTNGRRSRVDRVRIIRLIITFEGGHAGRHSNDFLLREMLLWPLRCVFYRVAHLHVFI